MSTSGRGGQSSANRDNSERSTEAHTIIVAGQGVTVFCFVLFLTLLECISKSRVVLFETQNSNYTIDGFKK